MKDKAKKRKRNREDAKIDKVRALIESGHEHISREEVDEGLAKLREAFQLDPSSAEAADNLGCALADAGAAEEACEVLKRAVELSPSDGHEKYMYLGQLLEGEQSLAAVKAGVKVLRHQCTEGADVKPQLCSALCSLAELLLNSTEEAEGEVGDEIDVLVDEAAEMDPTSAEPMQVRASLRNEQGRQSEGLEALKVSLSKWLKPPTKGKPKKDEDDSDEDNNDDEDNEGEDDEDDEDDEEWSDEYLESLPSFEFRFESAKLLLDLDESTEVALRVLRGLLRENDSSVDLWYLLALAHYGACQFDETRECIELGLKAVKKQLKDDPELKKQKKSEFEELRIAMQESEKTLGIEDDEDNSDNEIDD